MAFYIPHYIQSFFRLSREKGGLKMVNAHKVKTRHPYCEQLPVQWEKEVRAFFFPCFQFHYVILSNQPYPCNLRKQGDLFWFENKMGLNHFVQSSMDGILDCHPDKFSSVHYMTSHLHSDHHARCIYQSRGYFILKLHFSGVVYAVPLCAHPAAPTPGPPLAPEHPADRGSTCCCGSCRNTARSQCCYTRSAW